MTTDVHAELKDALVRAIQAERDGFAFYTMAARATRDEQGKETFERMAQDEADHATFLESHYKAILETGALHPTAVLGAPKPFPEAFPIFSPRIRERLHDAQMELSALSIAVELELKSRQFYREQAAKATDHQVKSFFEELAAWEGEHYGALSRDLDSLKEDQWNAARFTPLY